MSHGVQFRLRIRRGNTVAVGPGKIVLLEAIESTGSISAAARSLDMSYRRAWLLIDEMNKSMIRPAVGKLAGGAHGGGAFLTPDGKKMIKLYREIERKACFAAAREIGAISRMLNK
jgi:molybdate transport system regulatory protein